MHDEVERSRMAGGQRSAPFEIELLRNVPAAEVRRFLSIARRRRFAKGEPLFHEGDLADSLHLVVKGSLAVRVGVHLGADATIEVLGRGEVVGELGLVSGTYRRSATVVALQPSETLGVAHSSFLELRQTHPAVTDVLLEIMARRSVAASARLAEALFLPAEQRILRRLVDLATAYRAAGGCAPVSVPLTQADLASLAGTTRQTVNAVLRREAADGHLAVGRGSVEVIDPGHLRRRAGLGSGPRPAPAN